MSSSEMVTHAEVGAWINDAIYKTDKSQRTDYSYSDRLGGEFLAKLEREGYCIVPADTEQPRVEAMIDELVGERGHFVFFTARPAYTVVDIWRDPDSVGKPSGGPLADVSHPDWRAALRAAYEQVRRGDGGERG